MEHILISPGKLKLMLTKSDLDKYELDCETIDSEDTLTRRAFRELLDDVKRVSGFDASDDKVFIQLYPSRDGGAEIYITRLTAHKEEKTHRDETIKLSNVYRFESINALLDLCKKIGTQPHTANPQNHLPSSSTAWEADGKYYLVCEDNITYRDYLRKGKTDRFGEYITDSAKRLQTTAALPYVKEHGTCICPRDAITVLSSLA